MVRQVRQVNQQNPPLPKRKRVDSSGNDHRRLIVKSGNATLIIASGLTKNACEVLESSIKNSIKNLGGKCECTFKTIM